MADQKQSLPNAPPSYTVQDSVASSSSATGGHSDPAEPQKAAPSKAAQGKGNDNDLPPPPFTSAPAPAAGLAPAPTHAPASASATQHTSLIVGGVPPLPEARSVTGRATARFLEAALYAFMFYILLMIILTGKLESSWNDAAKRRHRGHGDPGWHDGGDGWWTALFGAPTSGQNGTAEAQIGTRV
ncbi:unnamed protein product [Tilletia controversa]|uniref:Uncharacterized protein n=2 Tax=Tilletia TaxID=13289 RepID=A0A8X7T0I7_9BASI|nr:hypothetical protein CF336_g1551 [Tilletia laevis]KAE8205111.1 hypothetical protein CF328_g686 [Tilletia controversa]KAE8264318.1 hypothetical protein A4X03_0g1040 [Tilletia caries]KAE8207704.1 hypothetical protein CF335_g945 [Tilletia laevis]KAE8254080.1 hypothetical protein A4X06_0g1070 [Tilletia controversa]